MLRALNRDEEALNEFRTKGNLLDQPLAGLAMTYAKMGKRTEAMQVIRALDAREKTTVGGTHVHCRVLRRAGRPRRRDAMAPARVRCEDLYLSLLHQLEPSLVTAAVVGPAISGAACPGDGHDVSMNVRHHGFAGGTGAAGGSMLLKASTT